MIKKYMYKVYYIKESEIREALFDDKETADLTAIRGERKESWKLFTLWKQK